MKYQHAAALLAAMVGASALAACASGTSAPVYAGTASGIGTGVVRPGQTIVTARPPEFGIFGQPEPVAETIRPPQPQVPAATTFGAAGGFGAARDPPGVADAGAIGFDSAQALEVNPFDPVALNNLAVSKADQGQFQPAMALFERASRLAPDNAEVAANLARLRGYVQSYAAAGFDPATIPSAGSPVSSLRLPPEPPPLWTASSNRRPATGRANALSLPAVVDDYQSGACRRTAAKTRVTTPQAGCAPRR